MEFGEPQRVMLGDDSGGKGKGASRRVSREQAKETIEVVQGCTRLVDEGGDEATTGRRQRMNVETLNITRTKAQTFQADFEFLGKTQVLAALIAQVRTRARATLSYVSAWLFGPKYYARGQVIRQARTFLWFLALAVALAISAAPQSTSEAKRLIIAVDTSKSITLQQRQQWQPITEQLMHCLQPGDHVQIFAIHENTHDSAPLFNQIIPLKRGTTIEALKNYAQERQAFRAELKRALEKVFQAEPKAQVTDVFSIFDRLQPDARPTRLVLFTDAYHSARELNLEHMRLEPRQFGSYVQTEAAKHNWRSQQLKNIRVDVILPSVDCCTPTNYVNDRVLLARFYAYLIQAIGGQLGTFETHLEAN